MSNSPTFNFAIALWRCQRPRCGTITNLCIRMDAACPPGTDSAGSFSTKAWSVLLAIFMTPRKGGWTLNGADFGGAFGAIDGATTGFRAAAAAGADIVLAALRAGEEFFEVATGKAFRFESGIESGDAVAELETGTLAGEVAARTCGLT